MRMWEGERSKVTVDNEIIEHQSHAASEGEFCSQKGEDCRGFQSLSARIRQSRHAPALLSYKLSLQFINMAVNRLTNTTDET